MFGMSSTDFWEGDPQLYWAYRTFYFKKIEMEGDTMKYNAWLNGNTQSVGTYVAIAKGFGKGQQAEYPNYDEMFSDSPKKEKLSPQDAKQKIMDEYNYWARR